MHDLKSEGHLEKNQLSASLCYLSGDYILAVRRSLSEIPLRTLG